MKRIIIGIVALLLFGAVLAGIFGHKYRQIQQAIAKGKAFKPPPVTVSTGQVQTMTYAKSIHAVGSLTAVQSVQITAQISGNVTALYFRSGQVVKKGRRLVQLDNTTQLTQLQADQAGAKLAQINVHRDRRLIAARAISQAQLDTDLATLAVDQAKVAQDQADLHKLLITAPFSGYLGIREVSLGQYVSPGMPIVVLNKWRPIYVDFYVPQNDFSSVHPGQIVHLMVDAYPGRVFSGNVVALSSQVDTASRNISIRALLPNKRMLLRPGIFGQVTLLTGARQKVLAVNADAIAYNTFGDFVFVVAKMRQAGKTMLVAHSVLVKTGPTIGQSVAITSGLKAGQTVVTEGQLKLHPGAIVSVNNTVKP